MARRHKRWASLIGVFAAGGFFIWLGFKGWVVMAMPAHYLGCLVIAIGLAGSFGVNIWYGGPLDPRDDPKPEGTSRPPLR